MSNAESPGAVLRRRRRELSLSLEEVAGTTRIQRRYLEALEEERFDMLPGEAYAQGFLRLYAETLSLDAANLIRGYRQQKAPLSVPEADSPRRTGKMDVGFAAKALTAAALLLGAAGFWIFVCKTSPPSSHRAGEELATATPTVVRPGPTPLPSSPKVEEADDSAPEEKILPPDPAPSVPEKTTLPVLPPGGGVLRLEALRSTRLEVMVDDRMSQSYFLEPGILLSWEAGKVIRLRFEDPQAAILWVGEEKTEVGGRTEVEVVAGPSSTSASGRQRRR